MVAGEPTYPDLRSLLVEWAPAMRRVASSYVGAAQREDLTQDILLAIWESLPDFRQESSLRTFIYRIAHNRAIDYVRKQSRRPPMEEADELVSPAPGADEVAQARRRKHQLVAAIRTLPLSYRQPLTMSLDGLSYAEIGDILGISENNVGVRIHRARRDLQKTLDQQEDS